MTEDYRGSPDDPQSGHSVAQTLSADRILNALANQRRRYVVYWLRQNENPATLPDLADEIVVWEYETEIADVPGHEVERVYLSLYHAHVPKLVDAGVVEYDRDSDVVALSENATQIEHLLKAFAE